MMAKIIHIGHTDENEILAAALRLAKLGLPVLPVYAPILDGNRVVCSCGRGSECKSPGKHPIGQEWEKSASAEERAVRDRLACCPRQNLGLLTGAMAGIFVLDIDPRHGGDAALAEFEEANGKLPPTWRARTGGGGEHVIFKHPGFSVRGSASRLGPGLDIRGENNQILVAPSIHASGGQYEWQPGCAPWDRPVAEAPAALLELLRPRGKSKAFQAAATEAARSLPRTPAYGAKALDEACRAIESAPEGTRNPTLFRHAAAIYELVAGGEIDGGTASERLADAARTAGLGDTEIDNTIASARVRGMASPRVRPALPSNAPAPMSQEEFAVFVGQYCGDGPTGPATEPPQSINLTDAGNAARFAQLYKDRLRYVHERGWLWWDGTRWSPDKTGEIMRCARGVSRWYCNQASELSGKAADPERSPARRKALMEEADLYAEHAVKSESQRALLAIASLGASEKDLVSTLDLFDADPWLLNCQNGTLDLKTGTLREHHREDLLTKLCPVNYDASARFDRFDQMLSDVTGGNKELAEFVQTAVGYSLTGDTREDKLFVVHGPGGSGKSTLLEAVKTAMGDYAKTADFETFIKKHGDSGPRNDLADLVGSRMVISIEVEEGKHLAESVVKSLTGGDTIKARHLYSHLFEFRPQLKLWLCCNDKPRVRENDTGIWRRIVVIPFEHVIPAGRKDPGLKLLLREDPAARAAIIAWAVAGCQMWLKNGLKVPEVSERATQGYRSDMNPLREFFDDCCELHANAHVPVATLRAAYDRWCQENGNRKSLPPRTFNETLERHGCEKKGTRMFGEYSKVWFGIGLAADEVKPVKPKEGGVFQSSLNKISLERDVEKGGSCGFTGFNTQNHSANSGFGSAARPDGGHDIAQDIAKDQDQDEDVTQDHGNAIGVEPSVAERIRRAVASGDDAALAAITGRQPQQSDENESAREPGEEG